jgi:alpha-tubulin suppressor-like RCC1 family protein
VLIFYDWIFHLFSDKQQVFAWGLNDFGQLGIGNNENQFIPVVVKSLEGMNIIRVCCGWNHSIALTGSHFVSFLFSPFFSLRVLIFHG